MIVRTEHEPVSSPGPTLYRGRIRDDASRVWWRCRHLHRRSSAAADCAADELRRWITAGADRQEGP